MAAAGGRSGQILGWIELPLDLNARDAVREVLPNVDIHPSPAPTDVRATGSPRRLAGKGVRGRWAKPCNESSSRAPIMLRIRPGTPRTRPILHTYTPLQRLGVRRYNLPTCSSAMCAWWPSYERIQCAYLLRSYPSARSTPDSHAQSRRSRPLLEYPVLRPPEAQCILRVDVHRDGRLRWVWSAR